MNPSVLERPVRQHSAFLLPVIGADVPAILGTKHEPEKLLAKFSLAAERAGMQYPGGKYTTLEDVVAKQLQGWIDRNVSKDAIELLAGSPSVVVSGTGLWFYMIAESNLRTFRLKPVVEALEAAKPGLGWFVADVITDSGGHGMKVYGPSLMGYRALAEFQDTVTDAEFAKVIAAENSQPEPTTEEEIQQILDEHNENYRFYPSHVLEVVDGHAHLLGWSYELKTTPPKQLNANAARRALKAINLPARLKSCVEDAIALSKAFDGDRKGTFCWDGSDDHDSIGAVFMLPWDDPDLLYEMVEHEETELMNGGNGMECLLRMNIPSEASDSELDQLVRDILTYFEMWSRLGKLMRHFHEEGNNNES